MKKETKKSESVKIEDGVQVSMNNSVIEVSGEKGKITREMKHKKIKIKVESNEVVFEVEKMTKREKKMIGTFKSHLKNMMKGVLKGYEYKLKICAAHFPMNIAVQNNEFVVKNFLGETIPRVLKIREGAEVKIEGENVVVTGIDKEIVSQTAASIEQLTKIKNRDKTRFQDGIYIIQKDEKIIS